MRKLLTLAFSVLLFLPSLVLAASSITPAATRPGVSTLYSYRSTLVLQDDFLSGNTTTGSIGDLGWNLQGGSTTTVASETNRLGLVFRDTGAVLNTVTSVRLFSGSAGSSAGIDPALPHSMIWAVRLNNNDANTSMRVGEMAPSFTNPPADGIYIEKLDADTNWFCVTRAGGTQTRTDSGVAVTTVFVTHAFSRSTSGVQFSLNNVNVCGLITTNIPTVFTNPEVYINNSTAASKSYAIDYFQLIITGIVR